MRASATFLGVTAAVLIAGSATDVSAGAQSRSSTVSTPRPVLVCANDAATRRAFTREHGAAPVFVTAREAMSVRPSDPAWEAPRCMTAREHARLRGAAVQNAAAADRLME